MNDRPQSSASPKFLPNSNTQRAVAAALLFIVLILGASSLWRLVKPRPASSRYGPGYYAELRDRYHSHGIIERNGRRLLWARGKPDESDAEWFDVTDSTIDSEKLRHGIGKDTIAAIDQPVFVDLDDTWLKKAGIDDQTMVIGFARQGEAKAFPLRIMDRHELVNDRIGGLPVTVGW